MKKKTGGTAFDPHEEPVYFQAGLNSAGYFFGVERCEHTLMAVNDMLDTKGLYEDMQARIDRGQKVLLDSGIFWLTNRHMRAHGITMDEALSLHPTEIDGFEDLYDGYVATMKRFPGLWGYVEMDQGGAERKRETRAKLEAEGLAPMPVYHPVNDGWDYFDELCQQYDRICVGNVVQANKSDRCKLLRTLWERHRRYPDVWIHVLGLTPNEAIATYYFNSCDSSSIVNMLRYGFTNSTPIGMSSLKTFGSNDESLSYLRAREGDYAKATELVFSSAHFITHTWRAQWRAAKELGDPLPAVEDWEPSLR